MPMNDRLNWVPWLYGLISGFVGGGANAIVTGFSSVFLDSSTFNADHPGKLLTLVGVTFFFSGLFSAAMYLKQSPLPTLETTTTTETTTLQTNPPAVVVKRVETKETPS